MGHGPLDNGGYEGKTLASLNGPDADTKGCGVSLPRNPSSHLPAVESQLVSSLRARSGHLG